MFSHEQVWAKVNAAVDEGIRPLIEALSLFPELQTASSCQGSADRPATVTFRYGLDSPGQGWRKLSEFVFGWFGPKLMSKIGDSASLSLDLTTWGEAVGHLSVRPGCVQSVSEAVESIAKESSLPHTTAYARDTPCTSQ